MTGAMLNYMDALLPWDDLPDDERRRRRITIIMVLLALLVSVVIPFIKVPPKPRSEVDVVPERIARMVERKVELPPPPPPKPKEEVKEEAPKEAAKPKEAPKPAEVAKAREKASKIAKESGLDSLASLREDFDIPAPTGGLITSTEAAGTSRSLLTSRAGAGSGVGNAYAGGVSSGFGGGKAGGKGSAGMMGSGKMQSVASGIGAGAASTRAAGKDGKMRRSDEDIRKTFDRYGGKLNSAFQRALRDDPNLQGSVSLKLTIAPDGSVTAASISNSQLNNSELEGKIMAIVRGFNFGDEEVEIWSGTHTLNFFPN